MTISIEENCKLALEAENKTEHLKNLLDRLKEDRTQALAIWNSDYFPITILQIFTDSYYLLNTKNFTVEEDNKILICMDILQILVENKYIKSLFLESHLDYYLFPFLMASTEDSLKTSTLRLFCIILEDGTIDNINGSELLPILLRSVDSGSHEQQELSLEALSHIFMGKGLDYAVQTIDRFQAIDVVLGSLITKSIYTKKIDSLKQLFKIYIRLCEKPNVRHKIKEKIPEGIDSGEAMELYAEDSELAELKRSFLSAVHEK